MIQERRTDSGTGEAAGSWSLQLRSDTPKTILDLFDFANASARWAMVVVTPTRVPASAVSAATLRSQACYAGLLRTRSSELSIGGPGLAVLLGTESGACEMPTAAVELNTVHLTTALDSYLPTNGVTKGATTNTATPAVLTLPAYKSRRELIGQIVDACGAEWRLTIDSSGNIDLDAADNATLFGSTPSVLVIETTGGSEVGVVGLEAVELDQDHDIEDFVTKQWVLARADGVVTVGEASSAASMSYVAGTALKFEAVADSSGTDGANADTVAEVLLDARQTLKRNIRVQVRAEDVAGRTWGPSGASSSLVRCGDSVFVYDPLHGLVDTTNVRSFRGQQVFPITARVFGISWPVLAGMGVYLLSAESTPTATDLSEWVVPEDGPAVLDIGAQVRSPFAPVGSLAAPMSPFGDVPVSMMPEGWIAVSGGIGFQNSWVNYGGGEQAMQYRKVGDVVELRGTIKSGTVGFVPAFTLPAGYRPPAPIAVAVPANGAFGAVYIAATGDVDVFVGSNAAVNIVTRFSVTA